MLVFGMALELIPAKFRAVRDSGWVQTWVGWREAAVAFGFFSDDPGAIAEVAAERKLQKLNLFRHAMKLAHNLLQRI